MQFHKKKERQEVWSSEAYWRTSVFIVGKIAVNLTTAQPQKFCCHRSLLAKGNSLFVWMHPMNRAHYLDLWKHSSCPAMLALQPITKEKIERIQKEIDRIFWNISMLARIIMDKEKQWEMFSIPMICDMCNWKTSLFVFNTKAKGKTVGHCLFSITDITYNGYWEDCSLFSANMFYPVSTHHACLIDTFFLQRRKLFVKQGFNKSNVCVNNKQIRRKEWLLADFHSFLQPFWATKIVIKS